MVAFLSGFRCWLFQIDHAAIWEGVLSVGGSKGRKNWETFYGFCVLGYHHTPGFVEMLVAVSHPPVIPISSGRFQH